MPQPSFTKAMAAALLLAAGVLAQSDRGTLTGTVSDSTGALIPNANVTAVNPATGVELKTQTTGTGNYTVPSVPAGVYNLVVEVAGFRRFEQQGIRVQVAQTARVDVTMAVGSTADSVPSRRTPRCCALKTRRWPPRSAARS